jgi:hypothetical protein
MSLMEIVGVGIGILLLCILSALLSISSTLQAERQRHLRLEEILRRAWFRRHGHHLKVANRDLGECACSEKSPCMDHYGRYHRWCMGATEAVEIANELGPKVAKLL